MRVGRSESMLGEIAGVFIAEYPKLMGTMQAALDAGNAAELHRAAHTLKGSAGLFVAQPTVDAARRLEKIAEAGSLDGAGEAWSDLRSEVQRLIPALEDRVGVRSTPT